MRACADHVMRVSEQRVEGLTGNGRPNGPRNRQSLFLDRRDVKGLTAPGAGDPMTGAAKPPAAPSIVFPILPRRYRRRRLRGRCDSSHPPVPIRQMAQSLLFPG
jgi:hypothetical protein